MPGADPKPVSPGPEVPAGEDLPQRLALAALQAYWRRYTSDITVERPIIHYCTDLGEYAGRLTSAVKSGKVAGAKGSGAPISAVVLIVPTNAPERAKLLLAEVMDKIPWD